MFKRIVRVDIGNRCRESLPCLHNCTIYYNDGTKKGKCINSRIIALKYYRYLSPSHKDHVKKYLWCFWSFY